MDLERETGGGYVLVSAHFGVCLIPAIPASLPAGVSMSRLGSEAALFITLYRTHFPHSGAIILAIKWWNAPCQSRLLKC